MTTRRTLRASTLPRHAMALTLAALLACGAAPQASANVQSLSPALLANTSNRINPMNAPAASVTAFFYKQPVVLNREQHKALRIKPVSPSEGAAFAASNQAVPLLAAEFPDACLEYPIVFAKGSDGQWMALALTGLQAGANAFVDARGRWNARYVPASVRRYPFILAEGGSDQLSLAADMTALHTGKDGQALFDEQGEPTEFVRKLMPLLADFQVQAKLTSALGQKLEEAGLLNQQNLQVRLGDGRNAVVEGVWVVDEAKLRQLADDKVLAWFKGGDLAAIHAQMLSLRNLVPLLERSQSAPAEDKPKPARKSASKTRADAKADARND